MGMGWTRIYRGKLASFSFENVAKYWRYCRLYGINTATRLAFRRFRTPKGHPPTYVTALPSPTLTVAEHAPSRIEKIISVVIPTKNAGSNIDQLLRRLKSQTSVKEVQVIVVDSGSTDGTCDATQRQATRLVRIAPEQFTHSFARNTGAEYATGDYLLFMVQDALPLTNLWLWEMVTALETNTLSAVSCAEYPRADSDLFYQFLIHNHRGSGEISQDRILSWDESCSTYTGMRSNAQLSDVAALIRRDVFETYRFQKNYAEDLDLGLRLIRDGHKLGYLQSTKVLHSHNRPSYYFLKRGYVDVKFVVELFSSFLYPALDDKARLYSDVVKAYSKVAKLGRVFTVLQFPLPVRRFVEELRSALQADATGTVVVDQAFDPDLHGLMECLLKEDDVSFSIADARTNMILSHVLDYLDRLGIWISGVYDVVDSNLARDIVQAVHRAFALYSGTHLAYLYMTLASRGEVGQSVARLDRTLLSGV
jgi:glycosyltransferase involved in cell wall biosynthesis